MSTVPGPQPSGRARSVSQPIRDGVSQDIIARATQSKPARLSVSRAQSSNSVLRTTKSIEAINTHGRARSSSLMTVTEVGGDEFENVVDRSGMGTNENAAWVNAPGAWIMHPILILLVKILVDALPSMTQDVSWTVVNLAYMALSFLMFHHVTGVPFESTMTTGGVYDEYTLWEQIDSGAHYTPAKKWLTSVPIGLFLISTHYTKYDPVLFTLNFAALVFVLFPKLPILHRLRFHFMPAVNATPGPSRPPSR
ncbi:response to unfolded-protein [Dioszegia hungarica]|uniref:Response to unfolded-protein n=1 Tax=Dioszegia hungarica TaxID=4972 RepID=A0AA38LRR8_9TREE|nr:response to unfolded-protein [Dioszegia hungarica]KAI9634737.1 response to unfolded-protein [Dioszegia hungarica]